MTRCFAVDYNGNGPFAGFTFDLHLFQFFLCLV